ncbi:MAG: glycoside hydrolase family 25 protein [Treponema sp.]|nr:glycoside hydrolase family 25 protein [Treponema sp.]
MRAIFFAAAAAVWLSASGCKTVPAVPECGSDEIGFIDYYGEPQVVKINPNIKRHGYEAQLFRREKSKMFYDGAGFSVRQGVDISRHDKDVDWKKLRAGGYDFVILRAAWRGYQSGILHEDEHFKRNIRGALDAGLDVGVYVFSQAVSDEEALEEAEFVLELIRGYSITLPVVYDPENIAWEEARTDCVSAGQFTRNAVLFCERVREAGYEPMVYANLTWQTMRLDLEQLSGCKMWYADYSDVPQTPYHFDYWQHYSPKRVPGVRRKCDVNIMIVRE